MGTAPGPAGHPIVHDGARAGAGGPHAHRPDRGLARARVRRPPRHRQRLRHSGAPVVHRRAGGAARPAQRDRPQLLDVQRCQGGRARGRRDHRGDRRGGMVLLRQRGELRRGPRESARAPAPARIACGPARESPGRDRGRVALRGEHRPDPGDSPPARRGEPHRHALRRAHARDGGGRAARRGTRARHPDGSDGDGGADRRAGAGPPELAAWPRTARRARGALVRSLSHPVLPVPAILAFGGAPPADGTRIVATLPFWRRLPELTPEARRLVRKQAEGIHSNP